MNPIEARNRIVTFHNTYVSYVQARDAGSMEQANQLRMDMAHSSLAVQRDLDRVNLGMITLMDAPAAGGRRWPTPMVSVVLTQLAEKYNIEPGMIQVVLRQAIGEYERLAATPPLLAGLQATARAGAAILAFPFRAVLSGWALIGQNVLLVAALVGTLASAVTILQFLGRLPFIR